MDSFKFFSLLGIIITAVVSIYNLYLNLKNQRKTQRDLFFTKQFEFFMQLTSLIAEIEDKVIDMNTSYAELNETQNKIHDFANEIDMLISKNELIIPDALFFKINDHAKYLLDFSMMAFKSPDKINNDSRTEFLDKNSDIIDNIRDYIGIEHLSKENKKIVKGRVYKNKLKS